MDLNERQGADSAEGEWYDEIKYELIEKLLRNKNPLPVSILDIGCGQGGILRRIRDNYPQIKLVGVDPFLPPHVQDFLLSHSITTELSLAKITDSSFDLILMMDVLEHVENPGELLNNALKYASPTSQIFITVPAYQWLWSQHDVALGHYRRYTTNRLRSLLKSTGVKPQYTSLGYSLHSLFLGAVIPRTIEKVARNNSGTATSHLDRVGSSLFGRVATKVARALGIFDAKFLGRKLPFGLTCVALVNIHKSSQNNELQA